MGTIIKILGITFLLIFGFFLIAHFSKIGEQIIKAEKIEIEKRYNQSDSIVCILSVNKRKYKTGESPDLNVRIINQLDSSIILVGSLDGSEIGFRPPISYFEVRHKLLGEIENFSLFCATVNPLRKEDFRIIESKQRFDPYENIDDYGYFNAQQLEGINFYFPGIYEITYYYSTNKNSMKSKTEQVYDQRMKSELIEMWSKVPKLELTSNTVTIEYNL